MSQQQINLSPDLKKMQNNGYELEVKDGYAIVYRIPYLNSSGQILYGIMVSPLSMANERAVYDGNHVMHFSGEYPCNIDGTEISGIKHQDLDTNMAGVHINFSFSNKPDENYKDYFEKFENYINTVSRPAEAKDSNVTAKTYRKIVSADNGVFEYEDTNASRAGIDSILSKASESKIGIIGLGGTGSYILDLISKTSVKEIHLYDGDFFKQHNAFRAPGAPKKTIFEKDIAKVEYFSNIYKNIHKNIYPHHEFIIEENIQQLSNLSSVFISLDSGTGRKMIIEYLLSVGIPFVDTGMGVAITDNMLNGIVRTTLGQETTIEFINQHISFQDERDNVYDSNIQISELNALNAILAVIKWKQLLGIYIDINKKHNNLYSISDGEMTYED